MALSNVEEKKKSCSVFSLSLYFPCCMTLPHLNGKVAAAVARRRSHYDFKWMKSTVVLLFSHDRKSFPFKCNRRVNRIFGSLLPSPSPCSAPVPNTKTVTDAKDDSYHLILSPLLSHSLPLLSSPLLVAVLILNKTHIRVRLDGVSPSVSSSSDYRRVTLRNQSRNYG